MSSFFLGCALGAILGVLMAALCAAQKLTDNDYIARVDKVRKKAVEAEKIARALDDATKQAQVEGMWEAIKILYGEDHGE